MHVGTVCHTRTHGSTSADLSCSVIVSTCCRLDQQVSDHTVHTQPQDPTRTWWRGCAATGSNKDVVKRVCSRRQTPSRSLCTWHIPCSGRSCALRGGTAFPNDIPAVLCSPQKVLLCTLAAMMELPVALDRSLTVDYSVLCLRIDFYTSTHTDSYSNHQTEYASKLSQKGGILTPSDQDVWKLVCVPYCSRGTKQVSRTPNVSSMDFSLQWQFVENFKKYFTNLPLLQLSWSVVK